MTLIDTNVLLDLVTNDPSWANWSIRQLEAAALHGPLAINEIIYAELSIRYEKIEDLNAFIAKADLQFTTVPQTALFLAGKAFRAYRSAGGVKNGVMPDFFIGAHAAIDGIELLTRDPGRYRTYFPTVRLITPTND